MQTSLKLASMATFYHRHALALTQRDLSGFKQHSLLLLCYSPRFGDSIYWQIDS